MPFVTDTSSLDFAGRDVSRRQERSRRLMADCLLFVLFDSAMYVVYLMYETESCGYGSGLESEFRNLETEMQAIRDLFTCVFHNIKFSKIRFSVIITFPPHARFAKNE